MSRGMRNIPYEMFRASASDWNRESLVIFDVKHNRRAFTVILTDDKLRSLIEAAHASYAYSMI